MMPEITFKDIKSGIGSFRNYIKGDGNNFILYLVIVYLIIGVLILGLIAIIIGLMNG